MIMRPMRSVMPETRPAALAAHIESAIAQGLVAARQGAPTDLIPGLQSVAPQKFGFSVVLLDGTTVSRGDTTELFSLQSITKLFSLVALLQLQPDAWDAVGWEPTAHSFRSLAELEARGGRPRNPFVNAGALMVTDRLKSLTGDGFLPTLQLIQELAGNPRIRSVPSVARAEFANAHVNSAIAHLLANANQIHNPIPQLLRNYFRQCAIEASTEDTARAALFLARKDQEHVVLGFEDRRRVNAVLLTAGMYNASGDIAYRVGMPVKSGIGGGIVGVLPGIGTVCVWSPPIELPVELRGGLAALEEFSRRARWSIF
jgi:glutaminase